ncbi:hypothetical protein QVD17_04647 [Tagetes erecta]|uniref:Uncharacterized protein n=1 Tax=Tagetes erecta TaxID=13708 RepID=A0AAD8LH32_TARER|nr:hypothetical protein QVD17_04647 [Tagetes erecta]
MEEQKKRSSRKYDSFSSYQFMCRELSSELADYHKVNKRLLNPKHLAWLSDIEKDIEWKMWEIKNLERWGLDIVEPDLPINSVPRTSGVLCLTSGNDGQTPVKPDLKRCQKRIIKKGRIDIEYLELVHEAHISSMKSWSRTYCGTQDLNNVIESMVQRTKHGNTKRADEMKIYKELRNLKETKEATIAEPADLHWYPRGRSMRDIEFKRSVQHKINLRYCMLCIYKLYVGIKANVNTQVSN